MEEKSLSQIENELRSYEGGQGEEEYREFGANPDDEDSKFDYIPGMPKELGMPDKETMAYFKQKASEFGANPRFRKVVDHTTGEQIGTHSYGEGFVPNARGMEHGHTEHPTSIPNRTRFDDTDDVMRDDWWDKEMNRRINLRRRDLD
jgi:hypothetical protein